jgi:hypothetical protein
VYKIELTCGPGWDAPLFGRGISFDSSMSLAQVEALARAALEVARESARLPKPDGYRITCEGTFGAADAPRAKVHRSAWQEGAFSALCRLSLSDRTRVLLARFRLVGLP